MSIHMLGIDYLKASVDVRALFAFTKKSAAETMQTLKDSEGIEGCIILSTCNRMEVWVSTTESWEDCLVRKLCEIKGVDVTCYENFFVSRSNKEAVEHLFYLTCGLKSQILGEDQIITQVKDALSLARESFSTDSVLEVLFRMAVTASKKVKTEVVFPKGNSSVIHQAIRKLEEEGFTMQDKTCMVIGNGEMGKVAAQTLRAAGAYVTVTVRQYRSGMVSIPQGCARINYGERMEYLPQCDLVVSATASPNYTLTAELFENIEVPSELLLIDLAVPRDIDAGIAALPNITLYDIDSFKLQGNTQEMQESLEQAGCILAEQMQEFYIWFDGRDVIPRIQDIKEDAVEDLSLRISKIIQRTPMQEEDRDKLVETIHTAAGKVITKMLFGLRDTLEQDAFLECVAGLEKVYDED